MPGISFDEEDPVPAVRSDSFREGPTMVQ